ncbi:hypothetical protein [Glutamicibacter sp. PS]|uniref:hypothetical protein n=1 Tax=Glutamicibacter sp. PS TaxID=3075634 RepID=UPI0028507868|nr:hypothetical protein [Glutamicibacter sp. PS]MDR4532393.1 hypothetical protein [Glutamicibacter sp. PS]
MRWEKLFEDLETQFEAQLAEDARQEVAEGLRVEKARQTLTERLLWAVGQQVVLELPTVGDCRGRLLTVGDGYLSLDCVGKLYVVTFAALRFIRTSSRKLRRGEASRVSLNAVLRAALRDRSHVQLHACDGTHLGSGRLIQVGADFVELHAHPLGEFPRSDRPDHQYLLPTANLGWVVATDWD